MKKFGIVLVMALVVSGIAFADASVAVSASLSEVLTATVSASSAALTLDNSSAQGIGNATFNSNRKNWKVGVYSTNGGVVKGTDPLTSTVYSIAYTFKMTKTSGSALPATVFDSITLGNASNITYATMAARAASAGDVGAMTVAFNASDIADSAKAFAGLTYSDTIFVVVAAN